MLLKQQCTLLMCVKVFIICTSNAQSQYGEDYKYYDGPVTDSEYYYGDYGDESEIQEEGMHQLKTTTDDSLSSRE